MVGDYEGDWAYIRQGLVGKAPVGQGLVGKGVVAVQGLQVRGYRSPRDYRPSDCKLGQSLHKPDSEPFLRCHRNQTRP